MIIIVENTNSLLQWMSSKLPDIENDSVDIEINDTESNHQSITYYLYNSDQFNKYYNELSNDNDLVLQDTTSVVSDSLVRSDYIDNDTNYYLSIIADLDSDEYRIIVNDNTDESDDSNESGADN